MNVTLPEGIVIPENKPVPAGVGHPEAIPTSVRFHLARCSEAHKQQVMGAQQTIFKSSYELLWSCYQYFEWCEANPLTKIDTRFSGQHGKFYQAHVPQRRIFTEHALCVFLGITRSTWASYRGRPEFSETVTHIDDIMFHQKLEGAAVDHFNASIITRHLGLADKQEVSLPSETQPDISATMTADEAAEIYAKEREGK